MLLAICNVEDCCWLDVIDSSSYNVQLARSGTFCICDGHVPLRCNRIAVENESDGLQTFNISINVVDETRVTSASLPTVPIHQVATAPINAKRGIRARMEKSRQ